MMRLKTNNFFTKKSSTKIINQKIRTEIKILITKNIDM